MTKIDELKAKKKKLAAEKAELQKKLKTTGKNKKATLATKNNSKEQKNKIPDWMQAESKY